MDGNALEVALALWRIPSMRASLRQRPLPDDVGELIELAAGAPERLAKAAARTDETPEAVLEAARFYVREVLLCVGADAYRVLGVSRGAAPDQIKAHHRALQHWLHPDRRGDDWESVYATRINTAWGELRTPERRAAYDALNAQPLASAEAGSTPHRVLVNDWRAAPATETHWRGWLALGAAVAACLWLIVLVDRQASAPAPEWHVASDETPATGQTSQPTLAAPIERPQTRQQSGKDLRARDPSAQTLKASPVATTSPHAVAAAMASGGEPARARPGASVNAMATATPAPATQSVASAVVRDDVVVSAAATEPRVARTRTAVRVVATPAEPVTASPTRIERAPAAAAPSDDSDTLERVRLAHRRGRELTHYLAAPSRRVPPIWHSVAAQDAAASIRDRLDGGRSRVTRIFSRVRFGDPAWRIAADRATMTSTIRRVGNGADAATLRVGLAWRDGMWLVDSIETENLQ